MTYSDKLKVGILGCASIVEHALVNPARFLPELELYAIASRQYDKAMVYSKKYNIIKALSSYNDILSDPEVDFVYIALPNDAHVEWAIKAAKAKKHILVEKPLCLDVKSLYSLKEICEKEGVFILEALMVQHHAWQTELKKIIGSNIFGALKEIKTAITFIPKYDLAANYRGDPEKGGGCFFDLSPYWLQFVQSIRPLADVHYDGKSLFNGPKGIDMTFTASLEYIDNFKCYFEASFEKPYRAAHSLFFEKAILTVDDIFRANTGRFKISFTIEDLKEKTSRKLFFPPSNYYENQLRFFIDVIRGTRKNIMIENSIERIDLMNKIYCKSINSVNK
ncbi:MAG: Gfo/Idh/MocA family oxidoreductase [Chitinispirillaceae bacterium]|nr:Gfo/Idh/MocA family oxidoreductase [Chitinispirillaceae bacterium]